MRQRRRRLASSLSVLTAVALAFGSTARAQEPPPGGPQVQPQDNNVAPPPPPAAGPIVTLQADNPRARLQILGQALRWRDVCTAPCQVPVSPAGSYRVGGGSIRPSETFSLPPSPSVVVSAQVGSNVKHWIGIGMIIAGLANVAGGALYYAEADTFANSSSNTGGMSKTYFQTFGITFIVIGAIITAIGIPLSMSSTSVEVH